MLGINKRKNWNAGTNTASKTIPIVRSQSNKPRDCHPWVSSNPQQQITHMNPFPYRDRELYCENVPVSRIAAEYGTPVWIYSKAFLLHQLKQIQDAFAAVDPVICYSVKA